MNMLDSMQSNKCPKFDKNSERLEITPLFIVIYDSIKMMVTAIAIMMTSYWTMVRFKLFYSPRFRIIFEEKIPSKNLNNRTKGNDLFDNTNYDGRNSLFEN